MTKLIKKKIISWLEKSCANRISSEHFDTKRIIIHLSDMDNEKCVSFNIVKILINNTRV